MRILTIATALCLTHSVTLAQVVTHSSRGYTSTAMRANSLEWTFVRLGDAILIQDVMVNGKGPFRFLLDTGAHGAGRVDTALVEALQLPTTGSSTGIGPLGQEREMTRHRVDSLAIGSLSFTGLDMSSRDYNAELPPNLRPLHGILGYQLFSEYLLTINYPARTVSVTKGELSPSDGKNLLPVISEDGDPEIEVGIGDGSVRAVIDTGAVGDLILPESIAKELKFTGKATVMGRRGGVEIRSAKLDGALRLGSISIMNPTTITAPVRQPIIGIRLLTSLALTFDQRNARILVERPVETPTPEVERRTTDGACVVAPESGGGK